MTVRPIEGEPFHFEVSSRSRPGVTHFAHWLNRTCSCETFAYKNREHFALTGKNYICAHLQSAKDDFWDTMIEDVKAKLRPTQ